VGHDAAFGSAMIGIETNDTTCLFPDLNDLAIKKLSGFLHGCFVVFTFNDLRRPPNMTTLVEGVNAIRRHDPPATLKSYNGQPSGRRW
jgi:hypothetical protein